ncbi:hypothetical protein E4U41_007569 [Claviceps citrina]|nr:hypothetical protein E4U41_007569 [Claviceps citrina]
MMLVSWAVLVLPLAACGSTIRRMANLVTFGDSFTDEGRLDYFLEHRQPPPVGRMLPPSKNTRSGGASWGRIVADATGSRYYNYAVVGAMCTNKTDKRYISELDRPFPSVLEYEMETFEQDLLFPELYPDRWAENTVYALWIGTNDVGIAGFLTDTQRENSTLATFLDCIWQTLDRIYASGGRHFVLVNEIPLEHAPLYATPSAGPGNYKYWADEKAYNGTEYINKVREYGTSVNTMLGYGVPFHLLVQRRWPGASVSIFDVHSLMVGILEDPSRHLGQGANITAPYRVCLETCEDSSGDVRRFMWFDELHPTERMHQIFAHHFMDVVRGRSKYGVYWKDDGPVRT